MIWLTLTLTVSEQFQPNAFLFSVMITASIITAAETHQSVHRSTKNKPTFHTALYVITGNVHSIYHP